MMFSDPIIVVGTGRCGSSVVAGMLDLLGVHMGEDLLPADHNNPGGYWEDRAIYENDQAFLQDKRSEQDYYERLEKIINYRGVREDVWGIKHPPNATLLEYYHEATSGQAKVIWVKRNKSDTADSLCRAWDCPEDKADDLYDVRQEALSKHADQGKAYMEIEFEEVIENPPDTVEKLVEFTGVQLTDEQIRRAQSIPTQRDTQGDEVIIGTPRGGRTIDDEVANMRTRMAMDRRYQTEIVSVQDKPVAKARNKLCAYALEQEADWLLMVDDDNPVANGKNPLDLIQPDLDVVSFPTPLNTENGGQADWNQMIDIYGSFLPIPEEYQRSLGPMEAAGAGCILIKTDVLRGFDAPFSDERNEKRRIVRSEDFTFCVRARERGHLLWTHWDYPCDHYTRSNIRRELI